HPPSAAEASVWPVAPARHVLGPDMHVQAPPNLSDALGVLLAGGIDDWGGVSPVTIDHVNPERPWPALERLRAATEAAGEGLAPPLSRYPGYVGGGDPWVHADVRFPLLLPSGAEGPARRHALSAGGTQPPPHVFHAGATSRAGGPVGEVLDGVANGEEVGVDEIVTLLSARGPELARVADVADDLRRKAVGDVVTFVRNRNINYTNICTFKCRFCAFSKG